MLLQHKFFVALKYFYNSIMIFFSSNTTQTLLKQKQLLSQTTAQCYFNIFRFLLEFQENNFQVLYCNYFLFKLCYK